MGELVGAGSVKHQAQALASIQRRHARNSCGRTGTQRSDRQPVSQPASQSGGWAEQASSVQQCACTVKHRWAWQGGGKCIAHGACTWGRRMGPADGAGRRMGRHLPQAAHPGRSCGASALRAWTSQYCAVQLVGQEGESCGARVRELAECSHGNRAWGMEHGAWQGPLSTTACPGGDRRVGGQGPHR